LGSQPRPHAARAIAEQEGCPDTPTGPAWFMRTTRSCNSIRLHFPVIAVLIIAAVSPLSSWRCLDGTPCPMGGAMPHRQPQAVAAAQPTHPCCMSLVAGASGTPASLASDMQCVLSESDQILPHLPSCPPSAAETNSNLIAVPTLAYMVPLIRTAVWAVLTADLPPPPQLRSLPGRSPPPLSS
jgi:hypothetical protein